MRPNITIVIPDPYIPLDEYCRRTGMSKSTAENLISYGKTSNQAQRRAEKRAGRSQYGRPNRDGIKRV